jgi:hypothetical protein
MPTYEIKAPNGQVYHIDGPDGASDEDIRGEVLRQFPDSAGTLKAYPDTVREHPRDMGWDVASATQNAVAGIAQGAASVADLPMSLAKGVNRGINYAISEGGGGLLDLIGQHGEADKWRATGDKMDAAYANPPALADLIERVSPTPEGGGPSRFLGQVLGGMMVPLGPKGPPRITVPKALPAAAPSAAREIIDEGGKAGVRVLTSDVRPPRTFIGKNVRAISERIPFAGTGPVRAAQQGERVEAVKSLARDFGVEGSTDMLDDVADDLSKTRGARIKGLTAQKKAVIQGITAPFTDAPRTVAAIDEQIAKLEGIDPDAFAPVINKLKAFKANATEGKSLEQIEGNRRLLGDLFADSSLASIKGDGQKAINAIYNPLREDMGEFIKRHAGEGAFNTWSKANARLSGMAGEMSDKVFRGVLNDAESTPENVAKLLFSQKPSQVRRLMVNLSPEGRAKAQGAIIHRAIEKAGGIEKISPDTFANEIARQANAVGVIFDGSDLARVKGLERLLQSTKQASVASVAPPTGAQNMPMIGAFTAGSVFGAAAIPFLGGVGAMARIYESAAVRNLLVGLSKAPKGSKAESHLIERILKAATSQTSIHPNAANDAIAQSPAQVAAAEQENN